MGREGRRSVRERADTAVVVEDNHTARTRMEA